MSQPEGAEDSARHRRVSELFLEVCDLDSAARSTLLDLRCGADPGLRAAVEVLVARDHVTEGAALLQSTTAAAEGSQARARPPEPDPGAALLGSRVGSYRLVRLLGSGGMGTVYEAVQDSPRRSVALKLVRIGALGRETLQRFEHESQLMARLRHPGIAQVFEAGTHRPPGAPPGSLPEPFFAMEFVENACNLTEYCAANSLPVRARLELFASVCDAVHHGHVKGVIHRDLKPGNILVDGAGQAKVIDFGVARATESDIAAVTINTAVGQFVGTLNYMSPEQCEGDPDAIDTRSDVYSLGVVLYELLAARLPYELGTRSILEAPRIIREQAPVRLSTLDRALRGDIETIVLKALEKDRERRYTSAAEFAADIRRYLRHEPIAARPASRIYHLRMFTRRHKGLVIGLAAAFVGLSLGLAAALRQASRARTAETEARAALAESQLQNYVANIAAADGALRADDGGTALARLDAAPEALRGWEWRHLLARADRSASTLRVPDDPPTGIAVAPDGQHMLIYQEPHAIRLVDIASGTTIWSRTDLTGFLRPFSRDGRLVAARAEQAILILDALTGNEVGRVPTLTHPSWAMSASFHPDGRRIALVYNGGQVEVWDWRDARKLLDVSIGFLMWDIEFSPDGSLLAYRGRSGILLVDSDSGRTVHELAIPDEGETEETRAIRFSPDGSILAASHGKFIHLWDVATGELRTTIGTHTQRIFGLVFDAAGTAIASISADRTLRLWDVARGEPIDTLLGHSNVITNVAFCCGGRQLVTSSYDESIKFWDVPAAAPVRSLATPEGVPWFLAFTPDGRGLVCGAGALGSVVDRITLDRLVALAPGPEPNTSAHFAMSRDGRFVAGSNDEETLVLYAAASGDRLWSAHQVARVDSIDFRDDGQWVANSVRQQIDIYATESGELLRRICTPSEQNYDVRFQPRTGALASVGEDGPVQLWDASSGELLRTLADASLHSLCLAFSDDGCLLAVGTNEGTVAIWDAVAWSRIALLTGMQPEVWSVAFSPDGARLAAGSKNGAIHIWDTGSWHDLLQLRGHVGTVRSLCWSPDGRELASGGYDRTLKLWNAPPSPLPALATLAPADGR